MNKLPPSPGNPTDDSALLDEMRRSMRRQALEHLAEADRLDALYAAVTGEVAPVLATISTPNPDMGEF
ncbi:hypothetical protein KBY27_12015 [Ruegeria pomeroyi]|uniref:Uncharacterized protein n=1 Tax=Ruegeria pomeroyi TaxID=89184 RepID=A0A9Q3WLM3_9RHOB|nr:hypothetical protein [Ruegeria pomeroyi]MCE8538179.1 hypothetical protein [Ruegeria pomeroyi]